MFSTPESVAGINTHYTRCTPASRTYQDARHTHTPTMNPPMAPRHHTHIQKHIHDLATKNRQKHGNTTPTLRTTRRCIHSPLDRPTGPGCSCLRCTPVCVWDRMGGNWVLREHRGWAAPGPRRVAGAAAESTGRPLPAARPGLMPAPARLASSPMLGLNKEQPLLSGPAPLEPSEAVRGGGWPEALSLTEPSHAGGNSSLSDMAAAVGLQLAGSQVPRGRSLLRGWHGLRGREC